MNDFDETIYATTCWMKVFNMGAIVECLYQTANLVSVFTIVRSCIHYYFAARRLYYQLGETARGSLEVVKGIHTLLDFALNGLHLKINFARFVMYAFNYAPTE